MSRAPAGQGLAPDLGRFGVTSALQEARVYVDRMSLSTRARPLIFLPLLAACGEWPRYAHLPQDDIEGYPPGTDPSDAVQVDWADAEREGDPGNDTPPALVSIESGAGRLYYGSLDGSGWDSTLEIDHTVTCGEEIGTSEFPPVEQGDYTGDVDWVSVAPAAEGVLCARLELTLDDSLPEGFAYDMLLYNLDACNNPLTMYLNDDGQALGEALYEDEAGWSTTVTAGAPLGISLAGFIPNEVVTQQLAWRLGVALVPIAPSGDTLCPSLPEAQ